MCGSVQASPHRTGPRRSSGYPRRDPPGSCAPSSLPRETPRLSGFVPQAAQHRNRVPRSDPRSAGPAGTAPPTPGPVRLPARTPREIVTSTSLACRRGISRVPTGDRHMTTNTCLAARFGQRHPGGPIALIPETPRDVPVPEMPGRRTSTSPFPGAVSQGCPDTRQCGAPGPGAHAAPHGARRAACPRPDRPRSGRTRSSSRTPSSSPLSPVPGSSRAPLPYIDTCAAWPPVDPSPRSRQSPSRLGRFRLPRTKGTSPPTPSGARRVGTLAPCTQTHRDPIPNPQSHPNSRSRATCSWARRTSVSNASGSPS